MTEKKNILGFRLPFPAMEAELVDVIPVGAWQYEPKWDGFRCLVLRDGKSVFLQSKSGQPLGRYFPELVESFLKVPTSRFVLDGEIVIEKNDSLSFDDLLLRLHPAESRIRKLSESTPALYLAFDLLFHEKFGQLQNEALEDRRLYLEKFAGKDFDPKGRLHLSPASTRMADARAWFKKVSSGMDGIVAKRLGRPYESGNREGMQKVKHIRTVDCVVGGFRYGKKSKLVGSLLLGLYDNAGILHHVGFTSTIKANDKKDLTEKLEKLSGGSGFTGRAPGGPSRWNPEGSGEWEALKPKLVVEVGYDHFSGDRFRHGTRLLRWRPDKAPEQCTMDQVKSRTTRLRKMLAEAKKKRSLHPADR